MKPELREVRARLKQSTRTEFEKIIYDAMLTPQQEHIIRLHICEGVSICGIAERLGYSYSGIRKALNNQPPIRGADFFFKNFIIHIDM